MTFCSRLTSRAISIADYHCHLPVAKFEAWAKTVPATLRNPLYHWTHMELRRPFGMTELHDR